MSLKVDRPRVGFTGSVEDVVTKKTNDDRSTQSGFELGGKSTPLTNGATAIALPASSSRLTAALDEGNPEVVALYGAKPIPELAKTIAARRYPREALADLLRDQNASRGAKQPVLDNIERLRDPTTVTVVTGQQVGLLGGPLYSLFKALGAINEAARLSETGVSAVPVFWLASYDHDLAEVNHVGVLGEGQEPTKIELANPGRKDLTQVGDEKLGDDVGRFIDAFEAELGDAPNKAQTMSMLREIYTADETYAGAFAKFIGRLTDDHGLVILDPNRREFNALAKPVLEKELFGEPTGPRVAAASEKLESLGFQPQIDARDDRLNVFFVDDDGKRVALTKTDDGFATGGSPRNLSSAEARTLLDTAPERFSPSALLRPVVEDVVLPTIGYVGGPSERKYYAQVGTLYDWADVPAPQSMKRPSFAVVSSADAKTITGATGKTLTELLEDPQLMETLGRAGIPAEIATAYAAFPKHNSRLAEISETFETRVQAGAGRVVTAEIQDLKKAIGLSITRAKKAARGADLERLVKGLDGNAKNIDRQFDRLLESIEKAGPGHTPSSSPFGGIAKALNGLDGQAVKVGRQARPDLVSIMSRLKPRGRAPQEREMSIAQLVAEHGPDLVKTLLGRASVHAAGPELLVMPEQTS